MIVLKALLQGGALYTFDTMIIAAKHVHVHVHIGIQ